MESLETTAEAQCSTEGLERNVVQRKGTSEPPAAQTKGSPSAEAWHPQSPEGQSRNTCGSSEMSDSGKTQQLEDQQPPKSHGPAHRYREPSSYAQQGGPAPPPTKQKTGGHLAAVPLSSCGPAPLRKSPAVPAAPQHQCPPQPGTDLLSEDVCKMEPKPQKPGKYVCDYCGRACAKPSVLKKHIRSHTGERPYPCVPCGFSFKTKSNLYKHRKSHAHSVKAGTVPFSELGSCNANMDQGSFEGEGDLYSDGEQSTDTDEDTLNDAPVPDAAVEEPDSTAVKTLHLAAQKQGVTSTVAEDGSPQLREINASPAVAQVSRAIQSCTIKQRLALRLSEKRSSDTDQSLSLPSQSSKGSTDSGYFSRSESAEHQSGPPNTNAKSYQEIMFGKCYRPCPKQAIVVTCRADSSDYAPVEGKRSERGVSRVFTQEKELGESIKINTRSFAREEIRESQLDPSSDAGPLVRSNSMPTSSATSLSMPQGLRGSHSFDERTSPVGMRRLRRQAAFEHSAHEGHAEPESYGNIADGASLAPSGAGSDGFSEMITSANHQKPGLEFSTRKRRKEKREEEDLPGPYDAHCDPSEEMFDSARLYESKQASQAVVGKGPPESVQTQLDRFEMDVSVSSEATGRKMPGNVISVIQHTNSLNRSQSEPYPCQRQEGISSSARATKDGETQERANTAEMMGRQLSDCRLDQSYQMVPKLVRQSNIQVPEIRVTVEPDSPEKGPEPQVKELEKHVEEFQWPQRSETLSQFPPEKLPPKKKRLRLADIEHSSGESSFESACTSLSRSPSQDSNLSYCSSFSFDREESFKSASPGRLDDPGKPLELLAVPGSAHSLSVLHQRQQHEMRRSSSEQAPCNLRREFPEVRSVSFDYGSLSPTSKVRHGELSSMKEQSQGDSVRQESVNMDPEFTQVLPHMIPQYLSSALLSQTLPIFATGSACTQLSHSGLIVPVRIQTHVPSFGSITYTSVSRILDAQHDSVSSTTGFSHSVIGHARALSTDPHTVQVLDLSLAKLKTGIPLSLTSRTISTTNASSGGSNKRLLSPAGSLDLFMEVKQQKRVKEEKMFGQIVEEMSAVELGNCNVTEENRHMTEILSMSTQHPQDDLQRGSIISKQRIATGSPDGAESAMDSSYLESGAQPYSAQSISDFKEGSLDNKVKMDMVAQLVRSQDVPISDGEDPKVLSQFPSLRTTTGVSWCYLNYTKPSSSHDAPFSSVYATWCVSSHNPNPPDLSTSATLALLHSKQKRDTSVYTMAAMYQPGTGKLVSSLLLWRQRLEQLQRKPETKDVDVPYGRKAKDASCRGKTVKEDWKEREASSKQAVPTRIKIFEGGYKSNEDYVYVRGRGRGKYICEECGIRCKKPSMLKKHIRTHTDVRPYVCRVCNFAFKTKGNLTKHMKSKAHMKKCLELGVSVTVDDAEILESDDIQHELKTGGASAAKHQFSDADDSDGMDEEIDDIDEDEDEDDEYEGDSTPKACSRSASPQPCGGVASLSVTATAAVVHGCPFAALPGVDLHHRASGRRPCSDRRVVMAPGDPERLADEDSLSSTLSPDQGCFPFDPSYPSCLLSPGGWESPLREPSPSRLRYPSPRRELVSSRGRSSPRWDAASASTLRPGSPNLASGVQLLLSSPGCVERPLSPGAELAGKPSARGRQRVVLRAVSPRRGSYQHRAASWEKSRQQAMAEQLVSQQGAVEMELDRGVGVPQPGPASSPQSQNLLSHLPLHSQQRTQSLLPLVPIGGVQVHPAPPCSSPSGSLSPETSLQTGGAQGGGAAGEGSPLPPESGEDDWAGQRNRPSPPQTGEDPQENPAENPPSLSVRDSQQEENVHTCMQAIASLRITSEESTHAPSL